MTTQDQLRVLIAGGGTGGHVIPGLAIARELRDHHNAEVRFVGTARGIETKLVPEAGFPLQLIPVGPLKNEIWPLWTASYTLPVDLQCQSSCTSRRYRER